MAHDFIIIGGGAVGSATAMHLARRGAAPLVLDRFGVPNAFGSSHGLTRMVRMAYFEHPDYVPLLRAAYAGWRDIEAESMRSLLHLPGIIYAGPGDGEVIGGSRRAAERHGIAHELLDHAALRSRFPMLRNPESHVGLLEPEAGYVLCEMAVTTMMEVALRHGATLRSHTAVRSVEPDSGFVRVVTDDDVIEAACVIVAAGAWSTSLLPTLGWPLSVTRQVLAWIWPRQPERFAFDPRSPDAHASCLPCWGVEWPAGAMHYGFPMAIDGSTGLGLKLALHQRGAPAEAESVSRHVTAADIDDLRTFIREFLPDADGPIVDARVCLYTNTPDGDFALGRHPHSDRVIVASPCSGHGFKFAPAIGAALADLALDGTSKLPIGFLDARRFRNDA